MSATIEKLLEKIEKVKNYISDLEEMGEDPLSAQKELDKLTMELHRKNEMINESRSILKG